MTSALDVQVGGNHYKSMRIQPVEFITANDIPFREANVIKYVCRWKTKNGLDDLKKARHYLDMVIEEEQKRIDAADKKAQATAKGVDKYLPLRRRCTCLSPADCAGQCYRGSEPF